MKKLFLVVIVAAFAVTSAVAQEQKEAKSATEQKDLKSPEQMKADKAAWEKKFKEELKLTPEQTVKFDALNKEYGEKIDVVLKDASLDKDAQKEKKMGLKKEKEAKLLEILTPEQQAKYKEMMDKMMEKMKTEPPKQQ
jgi:Spy/CpxP family protein refolding chaperone